MLPLSGWKYFSGIVLQNSDPPGNSKLHSVIPTYHDRRFATLACVEGFGIDLASEGS